MTQADQMSVALLDDDGRRRLQLVLAPGWHVHDAPGTLAVLRPEADRAGFRTNVVVTRERVYAGCDAAAVMAAAERHVHAAYDAVDVRGERAVEGDEVEALVRLRSFDVRGHEVRLTQLHAVFDAGIDDERLPQRLLYQLIATCRAEDSATYRDAFATMIGGCRVTMSPVGSPAGERIEELE